MTTRRSYRPPSLPEHALEELRRMAGVQFDPAIVKALELHLTEIGLIVPPEPERTSWLGRMVA
jgi:HD-GYP domain-containing protein (c-di-GMP phosphodiesterase class II)